jgi:hypothetical protein
MSEVIKFEAAVYKVQTLQDHGIRVTLDLPETAIPQMAMLAECQRQGIPLLFEVKAIDSNIGAVTNAIQKGTKRKS